MSNIGQDLKYAARQWNHNRRFTFTVVLALALGIAAITSIFTVVHRILINPFGVRDPDRIVFVGAPMLPMLGDGLAFWGRCPTLAAIGHYRSGGANLINSKWSGRVATAVVSASFFSVFDITPQIGRPMIVRDESIGANQVAIVSDRLWSQAFSRDPEIIGHTFHLNGAPHTIIAVAPRDFQFPGHTDVWVPRAPGGSELDLGLDEQDDIPAIQRRSVIGRLKEGATVDESKVQMATLFERMKELSGQKGTNFGSGVQIVPLAHRIAKNFRDPILFLLAAVICVLLIVCINVSTLLMSRGMQRRKEVAIRYCLGGLPSSVLRMLFTENVFLAIASGLVGITLSYLSIELIRVIGPRSVPNLQDIGLNIHAISFAVAISAIVSIVVGLVPGIQLLRTNLVDSLNDISVTPKPRFRLSIRKMLVGLQIALAMLLFSVALLTIRSFAHISAVPLGFNTTHLLTANVGLPRTHYRTSADVERFQVRAVEAIRRVPGVLHTAVVNTLPLSGMGGGKLYVAAGGNTLGDAVAYHATGDYFRTMGIPLVAGRTFRVADSPKGPSVVIVNETAALRYLDEKLPVGRKLLIEGEEVPREIVGVVGDTKSLEVGEANLPQIYLPFFQPYRGNAAGVDMVFIIRTGSDPKTMIQTIRAEFHTLDNEVPLYRVRTMDQVVGASMSFQRFRTLLVALFACVSGLLVAVGVYGVVAHSVTCRTREFGIRLSMGAKPAQIFLMVVRETAVLSFVSVCLGAIAAIGLQRLLSSLLFGMTSADLPTLVCSGFALASIALIAAVIPAFRATAVQPATALRHL